MAALNIIQLTINNEPIAIKPNSFSMTGGRGERHVRTKMSGANTDTVVSVDIETSKSMSKFTLLTETSTSTKIFEWQDNFDANVVVAQDDAGNTYTFNRAIITTDPEIQSGVDGETEVEFESSSVAVS